MKKLFTIGMISAAFAVQAQTIEVRMKLGNASQQVTFNGPNVQNNQSDYEWTVLFDTDNNSSTGNIEGFDISMGVTNFKFSSALQFSGTIPRASDIKVYVLSGNTGMAGGSLNAEIDENTSELILKGDVNSPNLSNLMPYVRIRAYTRHYAGGVYYTDETNEGTISTGITDPSNDVRGGSNDVLDILKVTVRHIFGLGLNDESTGLNSTLFYPNPSSSGVFNLTEQVKINTVVDLTGAEVLYTLHNNQYILLENNPAGCYFVNLSNSAGSKTVKICK